MAGTPRKGRREGEEEVSNSEDGFWVRGTSGKKY